MATPIVLTDAFILINASNVSSYATSVELDVTVDDKETTAFGATAHTRIGGLKDGSIKVDFNQDVTAAGLDSIMWPLVGTVVTFEVRPTSSARSTSNPAYTGSVLVSGWNPLGNKVGDVATVSVQFPTTGAVTRQTS
jgi:hypothetical protein